MVTIALGGDTMLGRLVGAALAERAPATVWEPGLLEVLGEADVTIVNLECCVSTRGEPWPDPSKPFFFRAPPAAVESLEAAGVRAVWLANNHALDHGATALLDTFDHLGRAGISWAGAGRDEAEARRGTVIRAGGLSLGLVAFADHPEDFAARPRAAPGSGAAPASGSPTASGAPGIAWVDPGELSRTGPPAWLLAEVRRLAGVCDLVVVGVHWGPNMNLWPLDHHPGVARALVEAGASAIAGHSAHVPQPVGRVGVAPVLFDLGDLLDDYAVDPDLRNDLGILALWTPGVRLELVPLRLECARTTLATGRDRAILLDRLEADSRELGADLRRERGRLVLDLAG